MLCVRVVVKRRPCCEHHQGGGGSLWGVPLSAAAGCDSGGWDVFVLYICPYVNQSLPQW